jgi:hypothetical protein
VIAPVEDVAAGTIGFRASDRLSREDLADVILPPIREAIDRGEKLRLVFEIDPDFDGLAPRAAWHDFKADIDLGLGHHAAWERFAIVSDQDRVRHAIALFGWMAPGELRLFGESELEAAKAWLAA